MATSIKALRAYPTPLPYDGFRQAEWDKTANRAYCYQKPILLVNHNRKYFDFLFIVS
jgi:hypothetical protein